MGPGWISDLTATDPSYVLPAVLMATMFVQARLQPAAVDSTIAATATATATIASSGFVLS